MDVGVRGRAQSRGDSYSLVLTAEASGERQSRCGHRRDQILIKSYYEKLRTSKLTLTEQPKDEYA